MAFVTHVLNREVRKYANSFIKPGLLMTDICERIENATRALIEENGLIAGILSMKCTTKSQNTDLL